MKKLFCILAVVAMVAGLSTSCEKKCTCKQLENGKEVGTIEFDLSATGVTAKKCKDLNTSVEAGGEKIEMNCTKK